MVRRHVYDGERCTHCGVNIYDQWIYGAEDESDCVDREPMVYTTETPEIDWSPPIDSAIGLEHDGDEET